MCIITKLIQISVPTHKHSVHMHTQPPFGNLFKFLTQWESHTNTRERKCVFKGWKKQLNTKKLSTKQDRLQQFAVIRCLSWEHRNYYRLQTHITVNFSDFNCFLSQKYLPHFTSSIVKPNYSPALSFSYPIFSCFLQALAWQFLRFLILVCTGYTFFQHPKKSP